MSVTQRLARVSAAHPWRMLATWGVVLLASIVAIGALLGSALTTDQDITSNPESKQAADLMFQSFPQQDGTSEYVVLHSRTLTADEPAFQEFVTEVRSSLEGTGATNAVGDPYAAENSTAISQDQHAVLLAVSMGNDAETGIVDVLDEVEAADENPAFDVAITGEFTLDHDFNELASHDLEKGELQFGLPAALIVLLLVFGAVVAALVPMGIAIVSIIVAVAPGGGGRSAVTLSFFIVNMVTAMGLALGIDYSLFVLSRYREQRHNGQDKIDAIVATGGTASKAVLFSGSSFVVALSGCCWCPTRSCAASRSGRSSSVVITMVAALTLLPALLSLLGDRVNALRLPFFGRDQAAESPFWTRAVGVVVRRPAPRSVASVLVLLALALPVLDLRTGNAGRQLAAGQHLLQGRIRGGRAQLPPQCQLRPGAGRRRRRRRLAARPRRRWTRFETSLAEDSGVRPAGAASSRRTVTWPGEHPGARRPEQRPGPRRGGAAAQRPGARTRSAETELDGYVGGATAENIDYSDLINQWLPIVLAFVLGVSLILLTVRVPIARAGRDARWSSTCCRWARPTG